MKKNKLDVIGNQMVNDAFPITPFSRSDLERVYEIFGMDYFKKALVLINEKGIAVDRLIDFVNEVSVFLDFPDLWNQSPEKAEYFELILNRFED